MGNIVRNELDFVLAQPQKRSTQKGQSNQIFVGYGQNNKKRRHVQGAITLTSDFQD